MNIAFLTRGRGYGHAARDLRIIEALHRARPDLTIDLMSSGTGLEYYRSRGVSCIDLGIDDVDDQSTASAWRVWRRLARTPSPWQLVVTDEVLSALPFAHHVLDTPAVVLTDWFYADFGRPEYDSAFDTAADVLVLDFPEAHPCAPETAAPVHHVGPVVAEFPVDRSTARTRLGVHDDEFLAVLTLGGMPERPEARRMLAGVLRAWYLSDDGCRLMVLADPPRAAAPPPGREDRLSWIGHTTDPELYYSAADVVLVDAMGFTGCELVFNRTRVVALTDPQALERFPTSFRRRLEHMIRCGWVCQAGTEDDPGRIWRQVTAAREGSQATGMPAADVDRLATLLLGSADGY